MSTLFFGAGGGELSDSCSISLPLLFVETLDFRLDFGVTGSSSSSSFSSVENQKPFLNATRATTSFGCEILPLISRNLFMYALSGSKSACLRFQRSASVTLVSMKTEYCFRNVGTNWESGSVKKRSYGSMQRRSSGGGSVKKRSSGGGSVKKRSSGGGSVMKRSYSGGSVKKRSYGGGSMQRSSSCGGSVKKRSSGGGSVKKRSSGGGSLKKRSYGGGSVKKISYGGGSMQRSSSGGGSVKKRSSGGGLVTIYGMQW
ncbi:keratin, type II cytoskeletal 2 epidermal-like [Brassica napus]|uniref:keratin, type II cytoskeletal 2 epidermal-like n=1 Tax=Brassica napus TaxID=3708 RepID=UPI0006AB132B|nr:keratin, type II cytoskeletal 2 epidermal-like [Brassica napus]